jgi:hypothetical protein
VAFGEQAIVRMGRLDRVLGYVGHACARAGRTDEARRLLAELEDEARHRYVPAYFLAMIRLALGERDAALAGLERARAEDDSMLRDLRVDRVWDPLRDEPRLRAIEASLRYPDAGAATRVL